jgi:hypothetical protein
MGMLGNEQNGHLAKTQIQRQIRQFLRCSVYQDTSLEHLGTVNTTHTWTAGKQKKKHVNKTELMAREKGLL